MAAMDAFAISQPRRIRRRRRRQDKPPASARLVLDDHVKSEHGILSEDLHKDLFPHLRPGNKHVVPTNDQAISTNPKQFARRRRPNHAPATSHNTARRDCTMGSLIHLPRSNMDHRPRIKIHRPCSRHPPVFSFLVCPPTLCHHTTAGRPFQAHPPLTQWHRDPRTRCCSRAARHCLCKPRGKLSSSP